MLEQREECMERAVEELAATIATLDAVEQEALWERVAALNLQRGLVALAEKYRQRLAKADTLQQSAEAVMAELQTLREDIAAHDYRG